MAKFEFVNEGLTAPAFLVDNSTRDHVLAAPARVDASAFTAGTNGLKAIPAGTLLGRTQTERDANAGYGPWTSGDTDVFLTWREISDAARDADVELLRPGTAIKENFLPGWSGSSSGYKAAVRAAYQCIAGIN